MQYTIITTTATFGVEGAHWALDPSGDLHVYASEADSADTVATVNSEHFVAIVDGNKAVGDADDLADIAPGVTAEVERAVRDALHDVDTIIN